MPRAAHSLPDTRDFTPANLPCVPDLAELLHRRTPQRPYLAASWATPIALRLRLIASGGRRNGPFCCQSAHAGTPFSPNCGRRPAGFGRHPGSVAQLWDVDNLRCCSLRQCQCVSVRYRQMELETAWLEVLQQVNAARPVSTHVQDAGQASPRLTHPPGARAEGAAWGRVFRGGTLASMWFPYVKQDDPLDVILVEESIPLGRHGALTVLYPPLDCPVFGASARLQKWR